MSTVAAQIYIRTVACDFDPFYPAIEAWVPPSEQRPRGLAISELGIEFADEPRNRFVHSSVASSTSPVSFVHIDAALVDLAWRAADAVETAAADMRFAMAMALQQGGDSAQLIRRKMHFWMCQSHHITPTETTAFTERRWIDGTEHDVARCFRLVGDSMFVMFLPLHGAPATCATCETRADLTALIDARVAELTPVT